MGVPALLRVTAWIPQGVGDPVEPLQANSHAGSRRQKRFGPLARAFRRVGWHGVSGMSANDRSYVESASHLADLMGCHRNTIGAWRKHGMPGKHKRGWHVPSVVAWLVERNGGAVESEDTAAAEDKERYLAEVRQQQARKLRRENERAAGELVRTEDVRLELAEVGAAFRSRAEVIERAYGSEVGQAIREMVDEAERAWQALLR